VAADPDLFTRWLAALDERHLANLTPQEVTRALRALSSCYVERRDKLASGAPLETAGKRAAFALFYAPQHFLVIDRILDALAGAIAGVDEIVDLGCGTGVAGAAWALAAGVRHVSGFDRNGWAVAEANWTYQQLGLNGRAARTDVDRVRMPAGVHTALVAGYTINELVPDVRERLLIRMLAAHRTGTQMLIVEPIARRGAAWWDPWQRAFVAAGGRADEWRFPLDLPPRQRALAKAAGLDPRELTARSLFAGGAG
jgi:hypothetical protein